MQLTREDLGKLQAKPRLLEYLIEKPKQHLHMSIEEPPVPCAQLKRYRKVAKNVMDMLAGIDQLSRGPRRAIDRGDLRKKSRPNVRRVSVPKRETPKKKAMTKAERQAKWRLSHSKVSDVLSPPTLLLACHPNGKIDLDELEGSPWDHPPWQSENEEKRP